MRPLALVFSALAAACGNLVGIGSADPPDPPPERASAATDPAASFRPKAEALPTCDEVTIVLGATADTVVLYEPSASMAYPSSNSYGRSDYLNVGLESQAGHFRGALVRFELDPDLSVAFAVDAIRSASLTVTAYPDCSGCDVDAGVLSASPMRSDWDEGDGSPYSGADPCRRTATQSGGGWGNAPAATSSSVIRAPDDYASVPAGHARYEDAASRIEVALDPGAVRAFLFTRPKAERASVSFFVASDSKLVIAAREAVAQGYAP
ncbi:MAG TPA: hypothetical protein VIF62_09200, partial [Labilithrix sp.]